jgi:hypothetical protein
MMMIVMNLEQGRHLVLPPVLVRDQHSVRACVYVFMFMFMFVFMCVCVCVCVCVRMCVFV